MPPAFLAHPYLSNYFDKISFFSELNYPTIQSAHFLYVYLLEFYGKTALF